MPTVRNNCKGNRCGVCPKCVEEMRAPSKTTIAAVEKERDELKKKLDKLITAVNDPKTPDKVGRVAFSLLIQQRDVMADYMRILARRLEAMATQRGDK